MAIRYCASVTLFCLILTAIAGQPDKVLSPTEYSHAFDGAFTGFNLGMANSQISGYTNGSFADPTTVAGITRHDHRINDLDDQQGNFLIGLHAGYGYSYKKFYLGGYGQYTYYPSRFHLFDYSFSNSQGIDHININLKQYYQFQIDLTPGIYLSTNSLIYVDAGLSVAGMRLTEQSNYMDIPNGVTAINNTSDKYKVKLAYALGLGMRNKFAPHWSLGLSEVYSIYNPINLNSSHTDNGDSTLSSDSRYTLYDDLFSVSLDYYFQKTAENASHFEEKNYFTGIYLEAQAGADKLLTDFSKSIDYRRGPIRFDLRPNQGALLGTNVIANLGIGGGINVRRFYIGLEASSGLGITEKVQNMTSAFDAVTQTLIALLPETFTFQQKQLVNINIKPGILLSDHDLFYALAGMAYNEFKFSAATSINFSGLTTASAPFSLHRTYKRTGWQIGLGMAHQFANGFALHLQDVYTFFSAINIATQHIGTGNLGGLGQPSFVYTSQLKVQTNQFTIGMDYYFHL